ncbi:g10049 [Coccomyxa elongata]
MRYPGPGSTTAAGHPISWLHKERISASRVPACYPTLPSSVRKRWFQLRRRQMGSSSMWEAYSTLRASTCGATRVDQDRDAWNVLQATHMLEGPIRLRCNRKYRFLTLEGRVG